MNDLVVKHNALTNASYSLSLTEQRLILLAIVDARSSKRGISANEPLTITAKAYEDQFLAHRNTAYQALKDACVNLFDRRFSYQLISENGNSERVVSRWVSEIRYVDNEAIVKLIFAPAVVPLITELEKHFTQYELEQVAGLNSAYAVRLYEVLMSWRGTQKTGEIELSELRNRLGVEDHEYQKMSDFKRRVLDLATTQINDHTDIKVQYQQHKSGRKIVGFSFAFSFKKKKKEAPSKSGSGHYTKMDLDKNPTLAKPGESYEQALRRLNSRNKILGTEEEQTKINL